ncbi:hypothetical protein [Paracoccus sp. (in: a-proteobacteria)]|uniref:hypothetical protein n=1 Tax=Paracoccus sp. TaxID=267 RepID=UPI00272B15F0|nr:hypothetical protein [Paracoccus sp. (in: a-proteobacteria)]
MQLNRLQSGSVVFRKEVKPEAERRETDTTTPNVTITNVTPATVGSPANFEVTFTLDSSHQVDGVEVRNYFGLSTVVIGDAHRSYFEVEDAAAAQLPELLRALADAVQADLDRVNTGRQSISAS